MMHNIVHMLWYSIKSQNFKEGKWYAEDIILDFYSDPIDWKPTFNIFNAVSDKPAR